MSLIELAPVSQELSQRQRWSNFFVIIYAVIVIVIGFQLKASIEGATILYSDAAVGVSAAYPQNWLLDTDGNYVFRAQDMSQPGFKTSIQVQVVSVNTQTTTRNLLDSLNLTRSQSLSAFRELTRETVDFREDVNSATRVLYTFVSSDLNPFLESLPTVVEGIDLLAIKGGQAVIVTFLSDADTFEQNLPIFEQFLNDLDF
jgi:hypothetical protein